MAEKRTKVENPLRGGPRMEKPPDPVSIIIFGATGDLTARKLIPALSSLCQSAIHPQNINIVGYARRPWSDDEFRVEMKQALEKYASDKVKSDLSWGTFASELSFVQGNFDNLSDFTELDEHLKQLSSQRRRNDNRLYYLAAPPGSYVDIVRNLSSAGMSRSSEGGWRRIVVEKPFGSDLQSARELNNEVHKAFDEEQVFRIDHYLGKETVQNILVLRFANTIFEPIWNRGYVDHVQITVAESVGVGNRVGFYDQAGIIRDIFQNHLLQLLTLVAMEAPVAFEANAIRDEKVKVLRSIRPIEDFTKQVVRAQYEKGTVEGEAVVGYLDEKDVPPNSTTPTYAALKLYIDNWRWEGVPFYLRSGKCLPTRATEISIHFNKPPHLLFKSHDGEMMHSNVLALRIQPDEGISLRIDAKLPGQRVVRYPVTMDFRYGTSFGLVNPPDAYERLILDAVLGESTLFARSDEIEWAWQVVDPILTQWETKKASALESYEAGTWGPPIADSFIENDGRHWRRL